MIALIQNKKKVLITSNPLNHEGGVVSYYRLFFEKYENNNIELMHHSVGSRMEYYYSPIKKIILYPLYYVNDLLKLIITLSFDDEIRIVQVSPSLNTVPLIRDALIVIIAKLFKRKIIVFYRGWRDVVAFKLKNNRLYQLMFRSVYYKVDVTIVLAVRFRDELVELGWKSENVIVTSTMFDSDKIIIPRNRKGKRLRLLYLGRVSYMKGVGEIIDAVELVVKKGLNVDCIIAGQGDREGVIENYKKSCERKGIKDYVSFIGHISGKSKYQVYSDSDVYILPSWTEGCPNAVLEALGSGLFVISTDVGALKDIINDGENGKIVHLKDNRHLADLLLWAYDNIDEIREKKLQISQDAKLKYDAMIITKQIGDIYNRLIFEK
jgi:glycosyltransferase involved in cell wall biosynthesis